MKYFKRRPKTKANCRAMSDSLMADHKESMAKLRAKQEANLEKMLGSVSSDTTFIVLNHGESIEDKLRRHFPDMEPQEIDYATRIIETIAEGEKNETRTDHVQK